MVKTAPKFHTTIVAVIIITTSSSSCTYVCTYIVFSLTLCVFSAALSSDRLYFSNFSFSNSFSAACKHKNHEFRLL